MIRKIIGLAIILAVIGAGLYIYYYTDYFTSSAQSSDRSLPGEIAINKIIDGDTIELDDGKRVRLIGIDTPEKGQRLYEEAKAKLSELVGNQKVRLEYDRETHDQYGRILAYIFIGDTFINAKMVESGFAKFIVIKPNDKYARELGVMEDKARHTRSGIWGIGPDEEYFYDPKAHIFHRYDCPLLENTPKYNRKTVKSAKAAYDMKLRRCNKCLPE